MENKTCSKPPTSFCIYIPHQKKTSTAAPSRPCRSSSTAAAASLLAPSLAAPRGATVELHGKTLYNGVWSAISLESVNRYRNPHGLMTMPNTGQFTKSWRWDISMCPLANWCPDLHRLGWSVSSLSRPVNLIFKPKKDIDMIYDIWRCSTDGPWVPK